MRVVSQAMTDTWKSGVFTGANKPIARVTIQQTQITVNDYLQQRYGTYLFGNSQGVFELPNIKSVKWTRSVDSDAGTCDIELYNTHELPIGVAPDSNDYVYNQPGFYTFNRGDQTNPWGHLPNGWTHRLYPDMLIRTYEGYGYTAGVGPEDDPKMMPSGVWIIDDVILGADATLTVKCRDAARLLMDQICFVPVIPSGIYPLKFEHFRTVNKPKEPVVTGGAKWINPAYDTDSSKPYGGPNLTIGTRRASDAFDGSDSTYWLSIGNASPTADFAYEWIQGKFTAQTVAAVRVYAKGGPYRVYISLHDPVKGWVGNSTIPYNPADPVSSPNGANIRYVAAATIGADKDTVVNVKDTPNIDRVRITFHDLWDSAYDPTRQGLKYRAACRDIDVLVGSGTTSWVDGGSDILGNYNDYSDIVKFLLGYGGFLWPLDSGLAYQMTTAGRVNMAPPLPDTVLWGLNVTDYRTKVVEANRAQIGQIWGDIETSGTYGPADLTTDIFDKKPLMDGISYVRDILGFIFYIDETGAAVFRSPNIWSLGNNLTDPTHRLTAGVTWAAPIGVKWTAETTGRKNYPTGWPDPNAYWIWDTSPELDSADNYSVLFQSTFTMPATGSYTIRGTADDYFDIWIDGVRVLTSTGTNTPVWKTMLSHTATLSAGTHTITARATNGPETGTTQLNAAGFLCSIVDSHGTVLRHTDTTNWTCRGETNFLVGGIQRLDGAADPTGSFIHIDESQTLMGLQATLSSRNIRERIVIANVAGQYGAVTEGFLPYKLPPAGLRRVAIWSDQFFESNKECQIMADLIAVRQLFTYRTDTITIPGYPAIQIDDQVKLTERVTEEVDDAHYVKGITSTLDMSTGEWTYQLDTHWLGDAPYTNWAFAPSNLAPDTQTYLTALGKIT